MAECLSEEKELANDKKARKKGGEENSKSRVEKKGRKIVERSGERRNRA